MKGSLYNEMVTSEGWYHIREISGKWVFKNLNEKGTETGKEWEHFGNKLVGRA